MKENEQFLPFPQNEQNSGRHDARVTEVLDVLQKSKGMCLFGFDNSLGQGLRHHEGIALYMNGETSNPAWIHVPISRIEEMYSDSSLKLDGFNNNGIGYVSVSKRENTWIIPTRKWEIARDAIDIMYGLNISRSHKYPYKHHQLGQLRPISLHSISVSDNRKIRS